MFCLDCGQKISANDEACPKCGLRVSEMRERIARAEEMVTYAETIGPASTQKMPPVPERVYKDKDGNVFKPEDKLTVPVREKQTSLADSIPQIGSSDPYITMPIKKVVSETGEVVLDADYGQKVYAQNSVKKSNWSVKKVLLILLLVIILAAASVFGYIQTLNNDTQKTNATSTSAKTDEQSASSTEEEITLDNTATQILSALVNSYQGLDASYKQLNTCIDEFEGYFLLVDMDSRISHAQGIFDLQTSVTADRRLLEQSMADLGVNESSSYYEQYRQIDVLYDYLLQRINVIATCWQNSLSYDDPRDYSQEILAPLAQDLQGGESNSESSFVSLYPLAIPHEV